MCAGIDGSHMKKRRVASSRPCIGFLIVGHDKLNVKLHEGEVGFQLNPPEAKRGIATS